MQDPSSREESWKEKMGEGGGLYIAGLSPSHGTGGTGKEGGIGRNEWGGSYTAGKHRLWTVDDISPRCRGRREWSRTTAVVD